MKAISKKTVDNSIAKDILILVSLSILFWCGISFPITLALGDKIYILLAILLFASIVVLHKTVGFNKKVNNYFFWQPGLFSYVSELLSSGGVFNFLMKSFLLVIINMALLYIILNSIKPY